MRTFMAGHDYRRTKTKFHFDFNPFPDIAGILIDSNLSKVLCTQFKSKEEVAGDID